MSQPQWNERDVTLLELLDRALDKGVVLWGDLTLSVANVDLVYVGLRVLLTSVETAHRAHIISTDRTLLSE
ncbi:MAG: gas vesicle protein [Chloroflexales bacterium]|nr:gas vesicle protein [Chloroflexales bacterium]